MSAGSNDVYRGYRGPCLDLMKREGVTVWSEVTAATTRGVFEGLILRADTSFGDTEGTWLARAHLAWIVGQRRHNRLVFGYEFKEAEYKNGDMTADYGYQGPTVGFNFRF